MAPVKPCRAYCVMPALSLMIGAVDLSPYTLCCLRPPHVGTLAAQTCKWGGCQCRDKITFCVRCEPHTCKYRALASLAHWVFHLAGVVQNMPTTFHRRRTAAGCSYAVMLMAQLQIDRGRGALLSCLFSVYYRLECTIDRTYPQSVEFGIFCQLT